MAQSALATSYRTHACGELTLPDVEALRGQTVALCGHVAKRVDESTFYLRDGYGQTLVQVDRGALPHVGDRASKLELEHVVRVSGFVEAAGRADPERPDVGALLCARDLEVLSAAEPLPPGVLDADEVDYEDRFTFRQLYLRRPEVQARMALRAEAAYAVREHLIERGYTEIETPHLFWYDQVAPDPEPVPAGNGRSFALPSGPVVLDQYVKAGQFDRFFQLVRTTRRDTAHSPWHAQEYTGLDMNLAYAEEDDFFRELEALCARLWRSVRGEELPTPFPRLSYAEALRRFGSDKPDLRFGLELIDVSAARGDDMVARGIRCPGAAARLYAADLMLVEAAAADHGRAGPGASFTWARIVPARKAGGAATLDGPAAELLQERPALLAALGGEPGDVVAIASAKAASDPEAAAELASFAAGRARRALGAMLDLVDESRCEPLWVHTYPFFELEDGQWVPRVVVFSRVAEERDLEIAIARPAERHLVRAKAFDLVIDGVEMASGYIGHHQLELQHQIWQNLFRMERGDLVRLRAPIEAHRFGVPPHGGINVGFDRLVARLAGVAAIDEVVPFPKTHACQDPMLDAPSPVPEAAVRALVEVAPPASYTIEDLVREVTEA